MEERTRGEDFMKQLERIAFQAHRITKIQRLGIDILSDILLQSLQISWPLFLTSFGVV